jgi:hypothetical protein
MLAYNPVASNASTAADKDSADPFLADDCTFVTCYSAQHVQVMLGCVHEPNAVRPLTFSHTLTDLEQVHCQGSLPLTHE